MAYGLKASSCHPLRGNGTQTKIEHVLCAISKLSSLILNKNWYKRAMAKLSEKLKNATKILVHQMVISDWTKQHLACFDQ